MIPALLILQGLVFALWAFTAFRILFHWRRKGAEMTGHPFQGPLTLIAVIRSWLRDPAERVWRWRLLLLTIALLGLSVGFYIASGTA